MAEVTTYMNYSIFFSDATEYAFATALAGGSFIATSPRNAASLFGIPHPYPSGDMATIPKGILFYSPFTPGSFINVTLADTVLCDDTVDSFLSLAHPGSPASIWPAGPNVRFVWSGNIIKANAGNVQPSPVTLIPQRRWITGFEWPSISEGGSGTIENFISRDASRTIEGFGFAIRSSNAGSVLSRAVDEYRTGLVTKTSWERFYIRFRRLPVANNSGVWRCHGSPSNAAGIGLKFTTTGTLDAYNINAVSTEVNIGTILTPTLNQWYRIDILLRYDSGVGTTGRIVFLVDGVGILAFSDVLGYGLNANTKHTTSELGQWTGVSDTQVEYDLDDWHNADLPSNLSAVILQPNTGDWPIDWLVGTHVKRHYSESATVVGWTGNGSVVNQSINPSQNLTNQLVSTNSGAVIEGVLDALPPDIQETIFPTLGPVSAIVNSKNSNVADTDGQLGYSLGGGGAVLDTIDQTNLSTIFTRAYLPSALALPIDVTPITVVHTKSLDANSDTTLSLSAIIEYIGVWGPEDDPTLIMPVNRLSFLHNCRYPNTGWGYVGSAPFAPCFAIGGTYLGNGTYQEILLPAPCHFLWIRPTAGGGGGVKFFGSSLDSHFGGTDRVIPNVRIWCRTLTGTIQFSVSGNDVEVNQSGVTYQYIAFCDPGMRFNLCGAFSHGTNVTAPISNALIEPFFDADAGFAQLEILNSTSNTAGLSYKGPGNTGIIGNMLAGAVKNNWGDFAEGIFNTQADLHFAGKSVNYSLWRMNQPNCNGVMVQIGYYVGNGVNPRTINVIPPSGRYPLFVLVTPTNGDPAYFRDPTHAGAASSNANTLGVSGTAIIGGGIDTIDVHSSLNANGVTYNVFIIPGSNLSWTNGIFYPNYCTPPLGPYIPPAVIAGNIIDMGEGGLIIGENPPITVLKDCSGIYTIIANKTCDTLIDRQTGQSSLDVKIPDPTFKTGYVGG